MLAPKPQLFDEPSSRFAPTRHSNDVLWNRWLPAAAWFEALTLSNLIDQTLMSSISVGAFKAPMERAKETLIAK